MVKASTQRTANDEAAVLPFALPLELSVSDPELVRELTAYPEGQPRDDYALCALKIGLLALKQARGQIDGDTIRREGDALLAALSDKLREHAQGLNDRLTHELKHYFDPESGRLPERIGRLVKKDGELEEVLRRQIGQSDSELCRTLATHFGNDSPLMKLLSPKESEGLLKSLKDSLSESLTDQRQRVLSEFSLDNQESALSRLVKKLTDHHGDLSKDLTTKIDEVVKEFSLDNDDSALSRMRKHLETTSNAIDNHLTLDKKDSALSRLKQELFELLNQHSEANQQFQQEVKLALEQMKVRREEAQRSPVHGLQFEQVVFEYLQRECQKAGEIVEFTGATVGQIKNCKIGDSVIQMGPDHVAADAKIVVEAKDKGGYSLPSAREEIDQARKNRGACVGIFVFAKTTALEGLPPFQRVGDDLFVVWDADDPQSDVYLQAALMVARALCTRQAKQRDACTADFSGIDKAIIDIEKKAESLDEIDTSATTIKNGAEKILKRVELARKGIVDQVAALRELLGDLKASVQGAETPGSS